MHVFSSAWLAAAAVSFFCEQLATTPSGFLGAMVLAASAVLLPELLNRMAVPLLFQPDMTIATDPCDCDARVVARGIRQAMGGCLTEGRLFRLLISRVPGCVMTIGLNAVRQRVFVTIACDVLGSEEKKSQSVLPFFLPGEAATWYRLTGGGDSVRLCFRPTEGAEAGIVCETPVLGWRTVLALGGVFVALVWVWAGALVAGVVVLPFVMIRALTCRYGNGVRAMGVKPVAVILGSLSVIVFNLVRVGML